MLGNSEKLKEYYKVWFSYLFWEMKIWPFTDNPKVNKNWNRNNPNDKIKEKHK